MLPSYLTEDMKSRKKKSVKQERKIAKDTGGVVTAASGGGRNKADVNTLNFKIEAKRTDKDSITIQRVWLDKVETEAFSAGKEPAINIEIRDKNWYIIPEYLFKRLNEVDK